MSRAFETGVPAPVRVGAAVLATLVALLGGIPVPEAQAQGTRALPSPEARLMLLQGHDRPSLTQPEVPWPEGLQDQYDVLHYDLSIRLDPANGLIEGTCTIRLRPLVASLEQVELDLHHPEFAVRSVTRLDDPGSVVQLRWDVDKLRVYFLGDPPDQSDVVELLVDYIGRPRPVPGRSPAVTFDEAPDGTPRIHSFAEPDLAHGWWPCKDRPDDKATLDFEIEVPTPLQAVANGLLREVRPGRAGYRIWSWSHDYPIAPYLVGFSAARFAKWSEPWSWVEESGSERNMIVSYWSWPELADWAYQDFAVTRSMLDAFSERFGTYPFSAEKYDLVLFGEDGGMEHQTATGIGGSVVALSRGSGAIENILAHELAHQWWGDDVGIEDFSSVWLKEGLATWSEALWWEEGGGLPSYLEYMQDISRPLGGGEFSGTVQDPAELFGQAVYFKGAWVMHMLRWVLSGPSLDGHAEPTLDLLRAWRDGHAGDAVSTADFVEFFSREQPLDGGMQPWPLSEWFFPQWLEREGRPRYGIDVASHPAEGGFGWANAVRIEQLQGGDPYRMPLHVRLHLEGGREVDRIVFTETAVHDVNWWTERRVVDIELDPEGWVLKDEVQSIDIDRDQDGWADWEDGCPDVPDPEQVDVNGNGTPDACEPGLDFDGDGLPNESDCAPADPLAWRPPSVDTQLRVRALPGGRTLLRIDHPSPEGQRAYVGNVATGTFVSLRGDRSMANAFCIESGFEGEELETSLSFGSLGTYWVVTAENGCPRVVGPPTRRDPCP